MAEKGDSPFYPSHPVPIGFFFGRDQQLSRITERGVKRVAGGRPASIYVQGEYGIGKTSLAFLAQHTAEIRHNIHPIYCTVGGCRDLTDVAQALLQATIRSRAMDPTKSEVIGNLLGKYVGKQSLFGLVTFNFEALRADAPQLASPFGVLKFLDSLRERLGSAGVFLVFDEISGMAKEPSFGHFIKGIVDSNGGAQKPVPLLLMLCGVEECRQEMIRQHQPIDRIFDIVEVEPMPPSDAQEFFRVTFESAQVVCDQDAAELMARYSAGFPKIMQLIGEAAYWRDNDCHVSHDDALAAVIDAAHEVGRRYFDQQVLKVLRSPDYHSILNQIGKLGPNKWSFAKSEIELTDAENRKFDNFLQRMKALSVIRQGEARGEWVFNLRMVRLYIWLQGSAREAGKRQPNVSP